MRLGALEFGEVHSERLPAETLAETVLRIKEFDRMGLYRVWLGEHHRRSMTWSFPDPLIPAVATLTDHLVVGTGCALLKYRNPYRLAADFRLMASLFPSRIELGVGSGVLGASYSQIVASSGCDTATYEQRVNDLMGFLDAGSLSSEPHHGVFPSPLGGNRPEVWIMGSSLSSASLAGSSGANFCYALFTPSSKRTPEVISAFYGAARRPSRQRHGIAIAAGWYSDPKEARNAPPLDDYTGFARVSFSGTTRNFVEWLSATWEDYLRPEIVLLNQTVSALSSVEVWESLATEMTLGPESGRSSTTIG